MSRADECLKRLRTPTLKVAAESGLAPGELRPQAALVVATAPGKAGLQRYTRHFPGRVFILLDRLTEREFVAFFRLQMEFVIMDGQVPADDKHLSAIAKLPRKAWVDLKDKLIQLGVCSIEHGMWWDADQAVNLDFQRAASARGIKGAMAAAEKRRARDAA